MKKQLYVFLIGVCVMGVAQVKGQAFLDKEWVVAKIGKEKVSVSAEKMPWMQLSDGKVSGFSGCNRMIGSYALDGETLLFSNLGGTKMFCFDTQELEDQFMQTLAKTHYWKLKCRNLRLFDSEKKLIMTFKIKK